MWQQLPQRLVHPSYQGIKPSGDMRHKFFEATVIEQTVIELFSVKWEIWASQMKATPGNLTRSRVLILFVTKKMIVDHSKVNITFPTNFCHGANLNQLSEQPCSTSGLFIFILLPVYFRYIDLIENSVVHHTPTPTEKFLTWSHSQRISPLVPVTTTNHRTFDANGQRLRILLSDVSDQTTTNLMTVLLLTSTLTKCTNTKNKRTL